MHAPLLIALAVGPALVLVHVIYAADRHGREPVKNILRYVFLGALAGVLAAFAEGLLMRLVPGGTVAFVLSMFVAVALVEECCKFALLRWRAARDPEIDEPFDWIVYAVAVALGFATLENLFYVMRLGMLNGIVRALTAVPAHALLGTLMGDRLARASLECGAARRRLLRLAILEPALWHGAYDTLALGGARVVRHDPALGASLALLWLAVLVALWVVCVCRVLRHHRAAPMCLLPPILYALPRRLRRPSESGANRGS